MASQSSSILFMAFSSECSLLAAELMDSKSSKWGSRLCLSIFLREVPESGVMEYPTILFIFSQ